MNVGQFVAADYKSTSVSLSLPATKRRRSVCRCGLQSGVGQFVVAGYKSASVSLSLRATKRRSVCHCGSQNIGHFVIVGHKKRHTVCHCMLQKTSDSLSLWATKASDSLSLLVTKNGISMFQSVMYCFKTTHNC